MKLEALSEAAELLEKREDLEDFAERIAKDDARVKILTETVQLWGDKGPTLSFSSLFEAPSIIIDLAEHGRVRASLKTEVENRLKGVDEKLAALGVELPQPPPDKDKGKYW
jgi:hypothetical protein